MQVINNTANAIVILVITLCVAGLIYLLSPILMPFLAAALIAYLCNPLVNKLMHFSMPRLLSVIIVFSVLLFAFIALILLLMPLIQKQLLLFIEQLPNMIVWLQDKTVFLINYFDIQTTVDHDAIKNMLTENITKAGGAFSWIFKTMLQSGKALFEGLLYLILIPVVTFYLLRDWPILIETISGTIPRKIKPRIMQFARESDSVLSAFIRGQLLVMLIVAIIYAFGLTLLGLQTGLIIGVIIGLVSIIPYLGLIIGIVIASIAAYIQYGTFDIVLWVWLLFAIEHVFENFFLTPKLIGDRIGLHPVIVIFAILAGGTLFGFFGILLALPVASVLMVFIRNVREHYHA